MMKKIVMKVQSFFSGLTKNTFLLSFASLFADISTEMLYPILPIFLTQTLGASASIVGIVEGLAVSSQNIIQGFSGFLSDKLQRYKKIALIGYLLAALAKPSIGLASFWQEVLIGRFVDRVGVGIRSAPRDALIANSTDTKNRGKAFGLEGIGDNFGAFLGPLLAIFLLFVFHANLRVIFYCTIIPGLIAVLMISLVKESSRLSDAKKTLSLSLEKLPTQYWRYLFVTAVFGFGNSGTAFMILRTKQVGVSLITTIFIYAFFNLVAAAVSYPAGSLSDKFGRRKMLFVAFCVFLITSLGFVFSTNFWFLGILFILYGVFSGIYRAVGKAFAVDFVQPEQRASAVGWYATVVGFTTLFASIIAGQLWVRLAPQATFVYGALFAFLGIFALSICMPKESL